MIAAALGSCVCSQPMIASDMALGATVSKVANIAGSRRTLRSRVTWSSLATPHGGWRQWFFRDKVPSILESCSSGLGVQCSSFWRTFRSLRLVGPGAQKRYMPVCSQVQRRTEPRMQESKPVHSSKVLPAFCNHMDSSPCEIA